MSQQWYYTKDGLQQGPIGTAALKDVAASGQIQPTDLVWKEGMANWTAAGNLKGLFPTLNPTSPSLQPPVVFTGQSPSSDASPGSAPCQVHNIAPMRVALPDPSVIANEAPWYYALNGKRLGPVNNAGITHLLAQGAISNDSLVWREGFDNWTPIGQTSLRKTVTGPPPLTGSAVNNGFVWAVAFAPIIGTLLQYIIAGASHSNPKTLWFITLVLNIALCGVDDHILKQAGHDTKQIGGWVFLVPVYLFKRATALNQSLAYFTTWMICFFVSLFL